MSEPPNGNYQAPLRDNDGEIRKGTYIILLYPGHTFEEHCRIIGKDGKDIDFHVDLDLLKNLWPNSISYRCDHVSDKVLQDIRADPGVKAVYCEPAKGPEVE